MGMLDTLKSLVTWQPLPPAPPARKSSVVFEQGDYFRPAWYNTGIDYKAEAGDLGTNGIIMACIGWLMRAEPEAPWRLHRRTGDTVATVHDHPLLTLLEQPNPFYSGEALRQATVFSYNLAGNAYWRKVRNAGGRVIQLWYEPHLTIRAVWPADNSAFISKYQVLRGHQWYDVPVEDVVHFRDGVDPTPGRDRYGQRRLDAVLREVATDNEAARYTYTLLKNLGISPVVISPSNADTVWSGDEVAALKAAYTRNTTGDNRGGATVLGAAVKVDQLAFPPDTMDAGAIRMIPESRIAAALNMPAGIAGLLVGLEHNTYSNMEAAYKMAVMSNLAPYWRVVAQTVTHQLIPDLGNPATEYVGHDTTQVKVLQADQTAIYTRMNVGYQAGFLKRSEARLATGWPVAPDGSDDVYKDQAAAPAPLLGDGGPSKALVYTNGATYAEGT